MSSLSAVNDRADALGLVGFGLLAAGVIVLGIGSGGVAGAVALVALLVIGSAADAAATYWDKAALAREVKEKKQAQWYATPVTSCPWAWNENMLDRSRRHGDLLEEIDLYKQLESALTSEEPLEVDRIERLITEARAAFAPQAPEMNDPDDAQYEEDILRLKALCKDLKSRSA